MKKAETQVDGSVVFTIEHNRTVHRLLKLTKLFTQSISNRTSPSKKYRILLKKLWICILLSIRTTKLASRVASRPIKTDQK